MLQPNHSKAQLHRELAQVCSLLGGLLVDQVRCQRLIVFVKRVPLSTSLLDLKRKRSLLVLLSVIIELPY